MTDSSACDAALCCSSVRTRECFPAGSKVLCSGRGGFAVTRGCFFFLLKHAGVPRAPIEIIDYKIHASIALHGGFVSLDTD